MVNVHAHGPSGDVCRGCVSLRNEPTKLVNLCLDLLVGSLNFAHNRIVGHTARGGQTGRFPTRRIGDCPLP